MYRLLFSFPDITTIHANENSIDFPELDISLNANFTKKCDNLGLLGPDGLSTQNDFPKGVEAWAGNKDGFVEALINEAKNQGARIWFNAKVHNVIKSKEFD